MFNGNDESLDVLNLAGIMLGYQNLIENRKQSEENNIQRNNQKQAKEILDDLHWHFEQQNRLLNYQNRLLRQILDILKGENKNGL